jgi:hypothetical protein
MVRDKSLEIKISILYALQSNGKIEKIGLSNEKGVLGI